MAVQDCGRCRLVAGSYRGGRAGHASEEVVPFQFEMVRQLQLDFGLLDVSRDGSDKSFCMLTAEMKNQQKDAYQMDVNNSKVLVCVHVCV